MNRNETTVAKLTVHGAPFMTAKGRKAIAVWLRSQAKSIEADMVARRYTARYIVEKV